MCVQLACDAGTLKNVNERDFKNARGHDRWALCVEHGCQTDIVVPTSLTHPLITPGSGMVVAPRFTGGEFDATLPACGRVLVYFEGFVFGQYNDLGPRDRYKAAVHHAAGRAMTDYPTSAIVAIDAGDLTVVGTYTCGSDIDKAVTLDDIEFVQQWCNSK